jgi:hypothetical protein
MLERNSRKKSDEILSKISAFSVKNSDFWYSCEKEKAEIVFL